MIRRPPKRVPAPQPSRNPHRADPVPLREFARVQNPDSASASTGWWTDPPKDIDGMIHVLATRASHLQDESDEGICLREMLAMVDDAYQATQAEIRAQYPIAFFKPSYEQSLLLNAWIWGIDFVVCFSANRIGKTACMGVINPALWILPNNPEWEMFACRLAPDPFTKGASFIDNPHQDEGYYLDLQGRKVQTLPRPSIEQIDQIKFLLKLHPELLGDPALSHLDPVNSDKFARLQELCPAAFAQAWPAAPIEDSGTIWLGAPDNDFHRDIILKEWRKWIPSRNFSKWSESDLVFDITTNDDTNPSPTTHRFICKSYESEDTKWSGIAVRAIILTEGLTADVLNEVKQRIIEHGFGSWDYTPYEARNVGNKTALAYKVFKGTESLPLRAHIFTRFSARNAPAHILPESKRLDLIRMWDGKAEGDARLDGIFYSSSPLVLSRLDRLFHCVPWSKRELFERYPSGQIYRGFDPGYDHPSVCTWALLVPGNMWFFYRYYVERQKTISERAKDIVTLSGNTLRKDRYGPGPEDYNLIEVHDKPTSEPVLLTAADYHIFKTDENTGITYSNNYIKAGLSVTESTHMKPEDRALDLDDKLDRSDLRTHPVTGTTPGCRIFFLINGLGVDAALGKMEALFWDRLASGPNKGEAKDTVPLHKDDELDATCYLACGPYVWTNYVAERRNNWVDEEDLDQVVSAHRDKQFAPLQKWEAPATRGAVTSRGR